MSAACVHGPNRCKRDRPSGLVRWPADSPADKPHDAQWLASGAARRIVDPCLLSARSRAPQWSRETGTDPWRSPERAAAPVLAQCPILLPVVRAAADEK